MRKAAQEYINQIEQLDLSLEYQCVNALQRTPWQVNGFVVDVLRTCWDSGQEWIGLPPRDNLDLPKYPFSKEPKYLNEDEIVQFNAFKSARKSALKSTTRSAIKSAIKYASKSTRKSSFKSVRKSVVRCPFKSALKICAQICAQICDSILM